MFDDLMERDPKIRKIRAQSEARGKAEGLAEGEARGKAEGLQEAVLTIVEGRFPPLTELARKKVKHINKPDALSMVLKSLTVAPDENAARTLLELLVA
jgi:flagellar biosynthesis/type III secretory pathway protein FliH